MHILNANCAAIRISKDTQDVPEFTLCQATKAAGLKGAIQIPKAESVGSNVKVRVPTLNILKGVDVCYQVTADPESVDVFLDPGVFARLIGQIPMKVS